MNEKNCEDFLKILKKYKIFKVKSTGETNKILCSFYNQGFCRAGPGCMFDHPDGDCETHIRVKSCRD